MISLIKDETKVIAITKSSNFELFKNTFHIIIKSLSDVKVMSKSLGTMGIGGMQGKTVVKFPLFGTVEDAETNLVAEWE